MATIVNSDQVGKSIRDSAQINELFSETYGRVIAKLRRYSTARIVAMLPKLRIDGRDNTARRTRRSAAAKAASDVLRARSVEITESMYGGDPAPNRQHRGAYSAPPAM